MQFTQSASLVMMMWVLDPLPYSMFSPDTSSHSLTFKNPLAQSSCSLSSSWPRSKYANLWTLPCQHLREAFGLFRTNKIQLSFLPNVKNSNARLGFLFLLFLIFISRHLGVPMSESALRSLNMWCCDSWSWFSNVFLQL